MSGRSVRLALGLTLLLLSSPASAKQNNFVSGSPIGFGFVAGMEKLPLSDYPAGTPHTSSSRYSHYFGFQPFVDMVNFAVRLNLGWHIYPAMNGAGKDGNGEFSGSSSGGGFDLGVRMLLSPYQNAKLDQRAYFVLGFGQSSVKLKNERDYSTGTLQGKHREERVTGAGTEMSFGIGYEFFLLQNYSLQFEAGYVDRSVNSFSYKTSTDVTGATRTDGENAQNEFGRNAGFHVYSPYAQIVFNLNL